MFRKLLLLSIATASMIAGTLVGPGSALADGQTGLIENCNAVGNFKVVEGTNQNGIATAAIAGNGGCFAISPTDKIWWTNGRGGPWQLMPGNGRARFVEGSDIECGLQYVYVKAASGTVWTQYWSAGHWNGRWLGPNPGRCAGLVLA